MQKTASLNFCTPPSGPPASDPLPGYDSLLSHAFRKTGQAGRTHNDETGALGKAVCLSDSGHASPPQKECKN